MAEVPWKDWPHYITMQVHINKLRTQRPGLWVNYYGSKVRPITDHIATVLDRISILASGQIQSVELPSKVRLSEKSYSGHGALSVKCTFSECA